MADEPAFVRAQRAFSAYLRDPARAPPPADLPADRLAVYRDAVFANVRVLFQDNFPLVHRALGEERFLALVRDWFARHRARTPWFVELGREFLDYLERERSDPGDPACLRDLARYDWVETEIGADAREASRTGIDPDGDLLAGSPVVHPVARLERYDYPVHRTADVEDLQALAPEPVHLLVYRDDEYRFQVLELNPLAADLFERAAAADGRSGREILTAIAWEARHAQPEAVVRGGAEILAAWRERGIVAGIVIRDP